MAVVKRILNEAPSIAALVLVIIGVAETEASPIVDIVGALSSALLTIVARANFDGPVTMLEGRRLVRSNLRGQAGHGPPLNLLIQLLVVIVAVVLVIYVVKALVGA